MFLMPKLRVPITPLLAIKGFETQIVRWMIHSSTAMSGSALAPVHILVFPYPAQGHMLPLLDLAHQLLLTNPNLTLTLLVTPKNLPFLHPILSAHPTCIETLVLQFPHHPSLPPGVENVKDIGVHGNLGIINALGKLHDPVLQWFNSQASPPVAIISDFFLGWTQHLRIPRIAFYSSGAFLTCVLGHLWLNPDAALSSPVFSFPHIPGAPSFRAEHLPSIFRFYRESDPDWAFVRECMIANTLSWGRVFNTFDALEGEYLDHLRLRSNQVDGRRNWGVGPLNLLDGAESMNRGNPNPDSTDFNAVMGWLDGCPDGSVVYVCFGSQKVLNPDQVQALASGLEANGGRFIWVMKAGSAPPPEGFEERVGERGKVIKGWAPQTSILSHRAVGGFLSHCGWNSVMEAVACGAMILGWPMEADQYMNATHLVDHLGAAVRVCEGSGAVPDSAELGRKIAEAMSEDSPQKRRAKELRDKALGAVQPGGTSSRDLEALVQELVQLAHTQTSLEIAA